VESDDHAINTHLYIDANPWRARVVEHPRESDWTSYLALAEGLGSAFLTPHPVIAQLGKDSSERQAVYRRIMERYIKESPRFKMNGNGRQAADPLAGLRLSQYTEA
jgi:putative transposase